MGVKLSASTKRILRGEVVRTPKIPGGRRAALNRVAKKQKLYAKQGGLCAYCEYHFPIARLTYDHVVRKRDGGGNTIDNLVLACPPCNTRRELPVEPSLRVLIRREKQHSEYVKEYAI